MMAYSEDHIALAAEYALGTLDADERAQVETMMAVDQDFTAMVAGLGIQARRAEPDGRLGRAAADRLGEHQGRDRACPSRRRRWCCRRRRPPPAGPVVVAGAATVGSTTTFQSSIQLSSGCAALAQHCRAAMTAIAAALVAHASPSRSISRTCLPDGLRPKPRTQMVEVKTAGRRRGAVGAICRPAAEGRAAAPAFILTVDGATKNFTVRKVGAAAAEPGKSFELWLISDKLPQPRSLGVIGGGDFTARPVLSSYDADIVNAATYAVTVEQAGGSPDGNPHSAPVFTGKLIETVPPPVGSRRAVIRSRTKRKRPWGAGVFCSRLGGSWGLLHIHVATLGGW